MMTWLVIWMILLVTKVRHSATTDEKGSALEKWLTIGTAQTGVQVHAYRRMLQVSIAVCYLVDHNFITFKVLLSPHVCNDQLKHDSPSRWSFVGQ